MEGGARLLIWNMNRFPAMCGNARGAAIPAQPFRQLARDWVHTHFMTLSDTDCTSKYLTRQQLADRLHVCLRTVDHLKANRVIAYYQIGDLVRFRECDVDEYLASVRVGISGC